MYAIVTDRWISTDSIIDQLAPVLCHSYSAGRFSCQGRTIRVAGFRDARHCQKKLEGFPLKLQMVSAVWEDVSLEELIMVTEVTG